MMRLVLGVLVSLLLVSCPLTCGLEICGGADHDQHAHDEHSSDHPGESPGCPCDAPLHDCICHGAIPTVKNLTVDDLRHAASPMPAQPALTGLAPGSPTILVESLATAGSSGVTDPSQLRALLGVLLI